MITAALREAAKREEGQALVLACLLILVISIAVLSTVNLGHGIYERQRLQNTADAAAYSMAALEARAFNFYAFVNRTHVSHYVSAMVWQSILSFVYFVEAMSVDVLGVMTTLDCGRDPTAGTWVKAACNAVSAISVEVAMVVSFVRALLDAYKQLVRAMLFQLRTADPDRAIGRGIIPTYSTMNGMLTGAAEATLEATLQQVQSTSNDIVTANDPHADVTASRFAMGLLSACIMSRAHSREAWHATTGAVPTGQSHFVALPPEKRRDGDKISRAKRAMGAVSNATRFALDRNNHGAVGRAGLGWTTSRRLAELVDFPTDFELVHRLLVREVDGKWGQTKLLTHALPFGRNQATNGGNRIRDWEDPPDAPFGAMAQGDDLGSDDLYRINLGAHDQRLGSLTARHWLACRPSDPPDECWGDPRYDPSNVKHLPQRLMLKTSIWATQPRSSWESPAIHYRLVHVANGRLWPNGAGARPPRNWQPGREHSALGLSEIPIAVQLGAGSLTLHKYVANVRGVIDGNHPWHGVMPFPHFEPGQYASACTNDPNRTGTPSAQTAAQRSEEFNQPSTFALLTKSAAQMQNAGDSTGAGNSRPALLSSQGAASFAFTRAGGRLVLDDTRKEFLSAKGLHVMSRAQAYYHRPGNWHEQPNFFNPYWRPRLAAVLQGEHANPLISDFVAQLPRPFEGLPQKALTH